MELFEALKRRCSIRRYTGEVPTEQEIQTVLDTALLSPQLPMHDIHISVITNSALLKEAEENTERFCQLGYPTYNYGAACWILISGKHQTEGMPNTNFTGDMIRTNEYWTLGSMIQNMQLAATSIGLGFVAMNMSVVSLRDNPAFAEKLGVPNAYEPLGSLLLGKTEIELKERQVKRESLPITYLK